MIILRKFYPFSICAAEASTRKFYPFTLFHPRLILEKIVPWCIIMNFGGHASLL